MGRGGRYTVFGSNVLAAQFFTIVSPFASRIVFDSFIQQDYSRAVSYRNLKSLWSKTASKYKNQVVESGYSPQTPAIFIPFIQLAYRLMFHFIPSRANYAALSLSVWRTKQVSNLRVLLLSNMGPKGKKQAKFGTICF